MDDINSKGFDEIKQKKWIIPRIDLLHKNLIKSWESDSKRFQNDGNISISKLKEWRNIILSAIGGILTIFLAYNSSYPTEPLFFFIGVSIFIVIIVVIFIIFTKTITVFENIFNSIDNIYQDGIGNLLQSHGFITSRGAFLLETNYNYWRNYFYFTHLLLFAIMVNHAKEFRKLSNQYRIFSDLKNNLTHEAKTYETNLHLIPEYYSKFDQTIELPTGLLDYVNNSLEKHRVKKI
jgi:hypothetical protein